MKLHTSVIDRLIHLYETYGGHRNESRLRTVLQEVSLDTYDRQTTGEKILVLTEDLQREKDAQTAPGR